MSRFSVDWNSKARWFASEFVIVVTGVLTAMLLAAWAGRQDDAEREREYLRQLVADLETTDSILRSADLEMKEVDAATAKFARAFLMVDRPPADSLAAWLSRSWQWVAPHPVVGTAESLIASGDIRLISDVSLRSQITSYVESTRQREAEQQTFVNLWMQGYGEMAKGLDYAEVIGAVLTADQIDTSARDNVLYPIPAGRRRHPFPVNWDRVLGDQNVYRAVHMMHAAKLNLVGLRQVMSGSTTQLIAAVHDVQDR